MSNTIFTDAPDAAYSQLGVKPPGQRWFAFDVGMEEARQGGASKFVMAVWNYHAGADGKAFATWGITRDSETGSYWYRVARVKEGQDPANRKSLWEALHIAHGAQMPMFALLKDRKTRRCAPDHVFQISEVLLERDGSAIWLRLDVRQGQIGTQVEVARLPPLMEMVGSSAKDAKRSAKLSVSQYTAACELAATVEFDRAERSEAIKKLEAEHAVNPNSASVLLNNYRCLVHGLPIKAPMSADAMQCFVDNIIARLGGEGLPNVLASLEAYITYAQEQWGNSSEGMAHIFADLRRLRDQDEALQALALAASELLPPAADAEDAAASEVLRAIWVRGPQHAAFRRELQRRWSNACSVHGVPCNGQIRASHIMAWRLDTSLRGDVHNGLLLAVPLDSLFDRGLISFSDDGRLIRTHQLQAETVAHFGLKPGLRLNWDHLTETAKAAIRKNLVRHRGFHQALEPYIA